MKKPNPMRSLCRSIPACVDRQPDPHRQTRRFGQRVLSGVRALLAVSALAALAVSNHSGAQTLTPVNIALTPGGWGEVKAVANGYVVGSAFAANGERHAYRWSAASQTIRDLNPPGVTGSTATGVNSSGEVTGFYVDPADPDNGDPPFIACYWAADGTFTSLGVRLPWYPTILIADNGIIGATDRTGHVLRGTRSGVWQDLGTVSGSSGDPWLTGINARGDFIGNASGIRGDYSGSRGFVALASSTTLTILQSPGTTSGPPFAYQNEGERNIQLNGINDNGVVVGTYWDFRSRYYTNYGTDAYHNSHAFKWTAEGEFVDLGQLGTYPVPGVNQPNYRSFFASATAINNAGTIVGYSSTSNGGGAPFIYDSTTGTMVQLAGAGNDFGPVAINDNGIVAGSAGGQAYASVVIAGVRTYIVPVFAPQYNGTPGLPLMKGSTFASHGYPNDFSVQRAWAMGLPSAPPPATPPVIFTRTTATAEAWKKYTVSFIPTQSGDYTLSFNVLAGGPSGDNSILVDAVKVATGATTLLTDGFETPALPLNGYSLAAAGTATIGNWVFANYSGILDGSPPNWGLDLQGLGSADGTTQYATLRAVAGTLSTMKPLNTLTLVAGQTYTVEFYQASRRDFGGQVTYTVTIEEVQNDTTPPVITVPANVTAEATGPSGAAVTFTATANDGVSGSVPVIANPASGSTFPLGVTTVNLRASDDAGNTATAAFTITVRDTTAPVIAAPVTATAEATSPDGAAVTFVATASDLVSGTVTVTANPPSGSTFAIGFSSVSLSAKDAAGNSASGSILINVRDTTAPVISSLAPSSATLWPPNHKLVPITLTGVASDAVGVASLKIISATSNEPDNGLGDGDTAGDIEITGALTLNLRAERSGSSNGRVYTITVEAKDAAGNASTKTVTVSVPKSQGGK